jgi:hypothetical protein
MTINRPQLHNTEETVNMSWSLRALETFFTIFKHSLTSFRRNYARPPDWGLGKEQEIITVKLDVTWGFMGEERKAYRVLVENNNERDH